ncbi:MAG: MFS transporter [Micrococcales bacterium]
MIKRARFAVSLYFLIGGTALALWSVHIPSVEQRLGISHPEFGTALVALGGGAFVALQLVGWIADHYGSRLITALGGALLGLSMFLPSFAENYAQLIGAIFIMGFSMGFLDGSMNAHGVLVEKAYGRPIFSSMHALWSAGGLVGAGIGWVTLSAGLPMQLTVPSGGVVLAVCSFLAYFWLLPSGKVTAANSSHSKADKKTASKANRKFFWIVIALGFMSGFAALAEGTAVDWSALLSTSVLKTTEAVAATGLAAFSISMTTSRFLADKVVEKQGRYFVLRWGSLLCVVALLVVGSAVNLAVVLVGWLLLGIGASALVPQLFAAAAEIGEESHSSRNLSKVMALTYFGILGGPAIIGWLAATPLNLNWAIGLVSVLCLFIFLGAPLINRK